MPPKTLPQVMPQKGYVLMNKNTKVGDILRRDNDFIIKNPQYSCASGYNFYGIMIRTPSALGHRAVMDLQAAFGRKLINDRILQIDDIFDTKGVTYNNTLWINDMENPMRWEDLNPYENDIPHIIENIKKNNKKLSSVNLRYWEADDYLNNYNECFCKIVPVRENNMTYVDKIGKFRVLYEYLAYKLAEKLDLKNCIKVELIKENNLYHLRTEQAADYNEGVITVGDSRNFSHIDDYEENLKEMAFFDSLIMNQDRRLTNICYRINNDTLAITGLSKYFDHDFSFDCIYRDNESFEANYEYAYKGITPNNEFPPVRFKDMSFNEQALWSMDKDKYNKLKSAGYIDLNADGRLKRNKERIDYCNYVVNRRRVEILKLAEDSQ
jgi:hypothetical protein